MDQNGTSLERANKRIKELKGFYRHILIFVVVNGFLLLLQSGLLHPFMPEGFPAEPYYFDWVNGNIATWGLILVVHAIIVYRWKFSFFKRWEERQIQKYMEEDKNEMDRYR
ncbi:2TM domain-containing protein [Flagellimonas baculiformis]|uniref:2TM domain-containing protein n=1 Tax=Flagellimonas baculiformis TaxID=3067310 RepID=UPI00296FC7E2|nr:2TM domain-containing protein [Muricauda sp. D6]